MKNTTVRVVHLQGEHMVQLSTAHIPRKTSIALGEVERDIHFASLWSKLSYTSWHDYGWIIFCSSEAANEVRQEHPELADIIGLCANQNVSYLKLESDAPSVDGLPVFDW